MKKYIDSIKNTVLASSLPESEIYNQLIKGGFKVENYSAGALLHIDGEECTSLDIILSGKIVVERIDLSGNLLTISEFHRDDILGGNLLFSKQPFYPMTITAKTPSIILSMDKNTLFQILSENPEFLLTYLEFISDNAAILGNKIKHFIKKSIRESVMAYLEYESKRQKSTVIQLDMTKKALAERIGVERTSLSRELGKMRKEGLIAFDGKSITLLS